MLSTLRDPLVDGISPDRVGTHGLAAGAALTSKSFGRRDARMGPKLLEY
jgi:hypothetical protein